MDNQLKEIENKIYNYIDNKNVYSAKQYFKDKIVDPLREKISNYEKEKAEKRKKNELKSGYYLAHYTSLETIYSILKNHKEEINNEKNVLNFIQSVLKNRKKKEEVQFSSNYLRLYDYSYVNDPNEGMYLKNELKKNYKSLETIKEDINTESFICCFIHGKKDIGDKLKYWWSYGRDGLGCSIQISAGFEEAIFHPVFYGSSEIEDIKKKFKHYFEFIDRLEKNLNSEELKMLFIKELWKAFDKIRFLHKDEAYKSEKEYRCIKFPKTASDIKYHFKKEGPYLRSYLSIPELKADNLLGKDTTITIGPKVINKKKLRYRFEQLANQSGLEVKFSISKIHYRGNL